jgi:hypothetical protein
VQQIIVALLVAIAVIASIWKLMPARRRLQALLRLDAWSANRTWLASFRERVLKPRIVRAAGSGCAGCAANVGVRPQHPPR